MMKWTTSLEEHVRAGHLEKEDAEKVAQFLGIEFNLLRRVTLREYIRRLRGN